MKNKFLKTFTVVLLTLTFISHVPFNMDIQNPSEPGISVCNLGGDEIPFDDDDDKPHSP